MKKIVAINCSPRSTWNTATLVWEAGKSTEVKLHLIFQSINDIESV